MSIVMTEAVEDLEKRWTETTCPTSTPAIRTGDGMWRSVSVVNIPLSVNGGLANGEDPPNTA